jgi:hypothetical protein
MGRRRRGVGVASALRARSNKVVLLGLVELEGAGDALEDAVGGAGEVPAFHPHVVVDADAGEQCHFLSTQALDAPVSPVGGQAGLLWSEARASRAEELADLGSVVHANQRTSAAPPQGGTVITCNDRHSRGIREQPSLDKPSTRTNLFVRRAAGDQLLAQLKETMRATIMYGAGDVRVENVPDATLQLPTDAVVRVLRSCICGSDLHPYRNMPAFAEGTPMGHEFLGVVEELGAGVAGLAKGDVVIAPFVWSDNTCDFCREGLQTSCRHGLR